VKPAVLELLARDGFVEQLGADRIHDGIQQAVAAQLPGGEASLR
jgi:hypothetical protein